MLFSRFSYNFFLYSNKKCLGKTPRHKKMGLSGLEPPTSRLSGVRSNRLSYKPMCNTLLRYYIIFSFSSSIFQKFLHIFRKKELTSAINAFIVSKVCKFHHDAGMAELADALDLGSSGRPCRFKSCCPHSRDYRYS